MAYREENGLRVEIKDDVSSGLLVTMKTTTLHQKIKCEMIY